MNPPAHHRVLHVIDLQSPDKNYAGMFIVWDRLFGTFVEEATACHFGTVRRLLTFNPVVAQVAEFKFVADKARGGTLWDALRVWLMPPEWTAQGRKAIPPPPEHKHES